MLLRRVSGFGGPLLVFHKTSWLNSDFVSLVLKSDIQRETNFIFGRWRDLLFSVVLLRKTPRLLLVSIFYCFLRNIFQQLLLKVLVLFFLSREATCKFLSLIWLDHRRIRTLVLKFGLPAHS